NFSSDVNGGAGGDCKRDDDICIVKAPPTSSSSSTTTSSAISHPTYNYDYLRAKSKEYTRPIYHETNYITNPNDDYQTSIIPPTTPIRKDSHYYHYHLPTSTISSST
ncbi:unnamed protein product, partial [Rotaria sp. Silwood1]